MFLRTGGLSWTSVRVPGILSRVALRLYAVCGLASGLAMIIQAGSSLGLALVGALGWVFVWPLLIASYVVSLTQSWLPGTVDVADATVTVSRGRSVRIFAKSAIASALVVDRAVGQGRVATVEIELRDGDRLAVRVESVAVARALVEELGFGEAGARARVSLAKPTRRLFHPLLGVVAYVLATLLVAAIGASHLLEHGTGAVNYGLALGFATPALSVALYALLRRLTRAPAVTIGDDGVAIEGRRRRYVPRRAIAAVSRVRGAPLFIGMRDGTREVIRGAGLDLERVDAVGRLLEERHGPSASSPERFAAFERQGSSLADWRARLRGTLENAGYRAAARPVDDAAEIVRSPHATPDQRVGAALALRIAGEPPERIRVAAGAVVDEAVREALEAVAEDDDARAERALRRIAR